MKKIIRIIAPLAAAFLLASCGAYFENGNLKVKENGKEIISIGRDGFKLDGNATGLTLNENCLNIQYPNGSIVWDGEGFAVFHADGNIRVEDGKMVVTDKDGNKKALEAAGEGAQYDTGGGVLVKTGAKAAIPSGFPQDKVPLMEGFKLIASAELGSVLVVSGYVPKGTVDGAVEYYQPILSAGESYSHEKKGSSAVLKAKLGGTDITVYLAKSLTADAVNVSIVAGK